MMLRRRAFLGASGALAMGATLPFASLASRRAAAAAPSELVRDPEGVLDLGPGFSYRVIERAGDPMDDGYRVPGRPDGMGCFAGNDGTIILLRNHELTPLNMRDDGVGAFSRRPSHVYRSGERGSVTRVVLDAKTGERLSSNFVLYGTDRNCSGGESPWGWLSCEESVRDGHGYVFLCSPDADSAAPPKKIAGYGRFKHEAAVVHPVTLVAYLSEDRAGACFYRFVPRDPATPFEGRLQALAAKGSPRLVTAELSTGARFEAEWVDVDEVDPAGDTVRVQAQAKGAALVERGEGVALHGDDVYFVSTSGGPRRRGQIFRYRPTGATGGTVEVVAASTDPAVLDMPDNLVVAPWGDVYVAEDGGGEDYVRIVDATGTVRDFARNAKGGGELAGICFAPDGKELFVNLQDDGLTLGIRGPFPAAPVGALPGSRPSWTGRRGGRPSEAPSLAGSASASTAASSSAGVVGATVGLGAGAAWLGLRKKRSKATDA